MAKCVSRVGKRVLWVVAVAAAGTLAACASPGPRQVKVDNPSVTYTYRTDNDLLKASQQAATYCNQYGNVERTSRITNNGDGSNTVVFDCVKTTTSAAVVAVPTPVPAPMATPMAYTYRTDQELLDASRNAEAYCLRAGGPISSTIVNNPNGTKTVTFTCGPR
jgi:putative hemolysin